MAPPVAHMYSAYNGKTGILPWEGTGFLLGDRRFEKGDDRRMDHAVDRKRNRDIITQQEGHHG